MLSITTVSFAADKSVLDAAVNETAAFLLKTVTDPQVDSIGGEWAVIGLARSGYAVPDTWFESYYKTALKYVEDCKGVLHDRKYTEYSRMILGLTAAGYDPRNLAGYDLTAPLADFENTVWQGINGPIFALIALDSNSYAIPQNPTAKTQATRELYIGEILRRQIKDGGWNLTAGSEGKAAETEKGDPDITGMALQALAKYQDQAEVKAATDKALNFLSGLQNQNGGYTSWDSANSESAAQVLVALCELGIPLDDPRFIKNGHTLLDNILTFKNKDGSFKHAPGGSGNTQMSTEQAFYALVAAQRILAGKNSLYRMNDAKQRGNTTQRPAEAGLPDKNVNVKAMPVVSPGKTFNDIAGHANRQATEQLAARAIINGKTETSFDPDATMTRAEYAAIITRGLGLGGNSQFTIHNSQFADVNEGDWFFEYVGVAAEYGIVKGVSETKFNPGGTITRQEAAVMTARAAKLCGMDTTLDAATIRDILAPFGDYITVAGWARESLAFCYRGKILPDEEFDIQPTVAIKRCEIAQMLYNMLDKARLISLSD